MRTCSAWGAFPAIVTLLPALLAARDFHVATDGTDTAAGTRAAPFATVQRAAKSAAPGDTVLIHGGTYAMSSGQIAVTRRGRAHVTDLATSGEPGKPIRYFAAPGEKPVFDFSEVKPADCRVTAFHVSGSWLHFRGIAVTGVQVTITGHTQSICFDNEGDHNIYEQLEMHDGQAIGFWLGNGSDNLVLNCDAYRNHDFTSENKKGGNVDGFGFHVSKGSTGNVFRGCRAWFNSDDGFDLISTGEPVLIENCWAFYNGFDTAFKPLGDGNGFKLGGFGVQRPRRARRRPAPRHPPEPGGPQPRRRLLCQPPPRRHRSFQQHRLPQQRQFQPARPRPRARRRCPWLWAPSEKQPRLQRPHRSL